MERKDAAAKKCIIKNTTTDIMEVLRRSASENITTDIMEVAFLVEQSDCCDVVPH